MEESQSLLSTGSPGPGSPPPTPATPWLSCGQPSPQTPRSRGSQQPPPCPWQAGSLCRVQAGTLPDGSPRYVDALVTSAHLNRARTAWIVVVKSDDETPLAIEVQAKAVQPRRWHSTAASSLDDLFGGDESQAPSSGHLSDASAPATAPSASQDQSQQSHGAGSLNIVASASKSSRKRKRTLLFQALDETDVNLEEEQFALMERMYGAAGASSSAGDDIFASMSTTSRKRQAKAKAPVAGSANAAAAPMATAVAAPVSARKPRPKPAAPSLARTPSEELEAAILQAARVTKKETDDAISGKASPCKSRSRFGRGQQKRRAADALDSSEEEDGADGETRPSFNTPPSAPSEPLVLETFSDGRAPVQVPASINQYLRSYQREGVRFMYSRYRENSGALLGDDMGLGKTVQIIALLAAVFGKTGEERLDVRGEYERRMERLQQGRHAKDAPFKGPALVVGPAAVLFNWAKELNTWGYFRVAICHRDKKAEALLDAKNGKLDVLITVYETVRSNLQEFLAVPWHLIICDEVHKLKSHTSAVSKAMNQFASVRRRIGLTGTAVQNSLEEFWCLLNWTNPGCLGSLKTFKADFCKPMMRGQRHNATDGELGRGRKLQTIFAQKIKPMFLQRTKALIAAQLPKKEDTVVFCPLTDLQTEAYQQLLASPDFQLVKRSQEPCDCDSGLSRGQCCHKFTRYHKSGTICTCHNPARRRKCNVCHCPKPVDPEHGCLPWNDLSMAQLTTLQNVSNHLGLLLPNPRDSEDKRAKARELCAIAFRGNDKYLEIERTSSFLSLSSPETCGKMKVIRRLLPVWKESGSRVLIFSYSVRLLDMIEITVVAQGESYLRIDGSTSPEDRLRRADQFNEDSSIQLFLISTRAGGVGLNLTGANVVVVFDPNWNPAHDLQAQDRAFRIGQTRDVKVYRLIAAGSVEELVYARQIYKQQLARIGQSNSKERRYFEGVQGDPRRRGELFGLANLFTLSAPGAKTRDLIQRTKLKEAGCEAASFGLQIKAGTGALGDLHTGDDYELSCVLEDMDGEGAMAAAEGGAPPRSAKKPTLDVQSILKASGVEHAHFFEDVVGESGAEKQLSSRAVRLLENRHAAQGPPVPLYLSDSDFDTQDRVLVGPPSPGKGKGKRRAVAAPRPTTAGAGADTWPANRRRDLTGPTPESTQGDVYNAATASASLFSLPTQPSMTLFSDVSPHVAPEPLAAPPPHHLTQRALFLHMAVWSGLDKTLFAEGVVAMSAAERDELVDRFYSRTAEAAL